MAVENKIVTNNISAGLADVDVAARFSGNIVKKAVFSFEVAAADDNGSIYRIARLPAQAIVTSIKFISDAITAATDYDIGVYKPLELGGAVIDKECLVNGADISAGKAVLTEMLVPAPDAFGKSLIALAGHTDYQKYSSVDANTVGSAAGTIAGIIEYVDGV
jgi:hypothetical protein